MTWSKKDTWTKLLLCVEVIVDCSTTCGFHLGRFIIHHFPKKTFINRCHDRYKRYSVKICVCVQILGNALYK